MIPYNFKNQSLLENALTHPSAKKSKVDYERMEFFGDSILSMVIAEILYRERSHDDEGKLSIMHSNLVNCNSLVKIANIIDLGSFLIMDGGEEDCGGRSNERNLENAMEALIAAVYLDSDYETVTQFVRGLWSDLINDKSILDKDKKSLLQEWAQSHDYGLPIYTLISRIGMPHSPIFTIEVSVKQFKGIGSGRSKKESEHNAAADLLKVIEEQKSE
jgi:ribonuclease III